MIRCLTLLIAVTWAVAACDRRGAEETTGAGGPQPPAASSTPSDGSTSAANASSGAHDQKYAPGAKLRVLRDAKCEEVGPDASSEPWDISAGSFVTWVAEDGSYTIVEHGPGMQCRIASDAVGPY
jgi:hypothetical protein